MNTSLRSTFPQEGLCRGKDNNSQEPSSVVHVSLGVTGREVLGLGDNDTDLCLGVDVGIPRNLSL